MKKQPLIITIAALILLAGVAYLAGSINTNKDKAGATNTNQVKVDLSSKTKQLLQTQSLPEDVFVTEKKDAADALTKKTLIGIESRKTIAEFLVPEINGVSNIVHGFIAQTSDNSKILLKNIVTGESETAVSVSLTKESEKIETIAISATGKSIFFTTFTQYEKVKPVTTLLDYETLTKLYVYDVQSGSIQKILEQKTNLETIQLIMATDSFAIIRRFNTEGGPIATEIINRASGQVTKRLFGDRIGYSISPDKQKILFYPESMDGVIWTKGAKLFDVATQAFIDVPAFDGSALATSDDGEWPNRSEFIDVDWEKDGSNLYFIRRTFSNSDINNADVDIQKLVLSENKVTTLASFRTDQFSPGSIVAAIEGAVYVVGSTNAIIQTRLFPSNQVVKDIVAASVLYAE